MSYNYNKTNKANYFTISKQNFDPSKSPSETTVLNSSGIRIIETYPDRDFAQNVQFRRHQGDHSTGNRHLSAREKLSSHLGNSATAISVPVNILIDRSIKWIDTNVTSFINNIHAIVDPLGLEKFFNWFIADNNQNPFFTKPTLHQGTADSELSSYISSYLLSAFLIRNYHELENSLNAFIEANGNSSVIHQLLNNSIIKLKERSALLTQITNGFIKEVIYGIHTCVSNYKPILTVLCHYQLKNSNEIVLCTDDIESILTELLRTYMASKQRRLIQLNRKFNDTWNGHKQSETQPRKIQNKEDVQLLLNYIQSIHNLIVQTDDFSKECLAGLEPNSSQNSKINIQRTRYIWRK